MQDINNFIHYVYKFYGRHQLYDMDFTLHEIKTATCQRLQHQSIPFEGDTVDREIVRDIVLSNREETPQ